MNMISKILLAGVVCISLANSQEVVENNKTLEVVAKDNNGSTAKGVPTEDINKTLAQGKALIAPGLGDYPTTAMQVDFDGYVTVIRVDTRGKRSLLLPSESTPDTYVKKGTAIAMLDEGTIAVQLPRGLCYLMVVVSAERLVLGVATKEKKHISALEDDALLAKVLNDIRTGQYGQFAIKMLPIYKSKD